VARIMEDMHRAHPLERLYLSGGLANLSALQQGIAQCVPCAVSRLEQSESSLLGTAMLAAGLHPGSLRKVQEITVEVDNQKLVEKFQRWKDWLDNLLCSS
jgi:glycerol kinase